MLSTMTFEQSKDKKASEHDHSILAAFLKNIEKQLFATDKYQFIDSFFVVENLKVKGNNQTTTFRNSQDTESYHRDIIEVLATRDIKSNKIVKSIVKINCTRKDIVELQPTHKPINKLVNIEIEVSDEGIILCQKLSFTNTFNRKWKGMLTIEKHIAQDNAKQFLVFYKRIKEDNPKNGLFTHMNMTLGDEPTRLDNLMLVIQALHLLETDDKARELFQIEEQESENILMLLMQKSFDDLYRILSLFEMVNN